MNLTYRSFGSVCSWCQLPRINNGFKELGLIESDIPNFIYSNDPGGHNEAIDFKNKFSPKTKLILNVQDIPLWIKDYDVNKLINQLKQANAITSISEYTKKCVKEIGFDSSVIYQPIMNIFKTMPIENFKSKLLILGRFRDPNKRTKIVLDAFQILGYDLNKDIMAVGPDTGIPVGEEILNHFYNATEYVACGGKIEGLLLPCLEALSVGKIPIIFNDLTTRQELLPSDKFPEYDSVNPNSLDLVKFIVSMEGDNDIKEKFKERLFKHYKDNLEEKFKPVSVAKRITEVYEKL
jgi:hypothetical protein